MAYFSLFFCFSFGGKKNTEHSHRESQMCASLVISPFDLCFSPHCNFLSIFWEAYIVCADAGG